MRPVRAISPNLRVRRSVMNRTVHSSVSFDVLIALALASPLLSIVIARHVGTAFTVSRPRVAAKVNHVLLLMAEIDVTQSVRQPLFVHSRISKNATGGA